MYTVESPLSITDKSFLCSNTLWFNDDSILDFKWGSRFAIHWWTTYDRWVFNVDKDSVQVATLAKIKWSDTSFIINVDPNTDSIKAGWLNFENGGIQWDVWRIILVVTFDMFSRKIRWNSIQFFIGDRAFKDLRFQWKSIIPALDHLLRKVTHVHCYVDYQVEFGCNIMLKN